MKHQHIPIAGLLPKHLRCGPSVLSMTVWAELHALIVGQVSDADSTAGLPKQRLATPGRVEAVPRAICSPETGH